MNGRGFVLAVVLLVLALAGAFLAVAMSGAVASVRAGRAWSESVRAEVGAWALPGAESLVLGDSLVLITAEGTAGRARWPVFLLVRPSGDSASPGAARPVQAYPRVHPRP